MKHRVVYVLLATAMCWITLTSKRTGLMNNFSQDRTGSPFSASTCGACHSGGSFTPSISAILRDTATGNSVTAYEAGLAYDIEITVNAGSGSPNTYGFQSVILDDAFNLNAGTLFNNSANSRFVVNGGRTYFEHNNSSTFTTNMFTSEWFSPGQGSGDVTIYATGIVSNNNGFTNGDQWTGNISVTFKEAIQDVGFTADTACLGSPTTLNASVASGSGPITYTWMDSAMNFLGTGASFNYTFNSLSNTVYVAASNGPSSDTTMATVLVSGPSVSLNRVYDDTCSAGTGYITVSASGGFGTYTYNWSNGGSGDSIGGLMAGNYTVTLTDALGCADTQTYILSSTPAVTASDSIIPTDCRQKNGAIDITVLTGTPSYNFNWSHTPTTEDVSGLSAGYYEVTITDALGCTVVVGDTVKPISDTIALSTVATPNNCGANNGMIDLTVSGGAAPPYTYNWSNGANIEDISNLGPGVYCVTVSDSNNCSSIACDTIVVDSTAPVFSDTVSICDGDTYRVAGKEYTMPGVYFDTTRNGCDSVYITDLSFRTAYDIMVSMDLCEGDTFFFGGIPLDTSGVYQDTFTATTLCDSMVELTINLFPVYHDTTTQVICPGDTVVFFGDTLTNPGLYDTALSTIDNCDSIIYLDLRFVDSVPVINFSLTNATCSSGDGLIQINVDSSDNYSVQWSTGDTVDMINNLSVGIYTVTVTDNITGCSTSEGIPISNIGVPILTPSVVAANCSTNNGSINVVATNGTAPYTFNWSTGDTGSTLNNLFSGWYSVTVVDSGGCSQHANVFVGNPTNCDVLIGGTVFHDLNKNCIHDVGEPGIPNVLMTLNTGVGTLTDSTGDYRFTQPPGTYTITQWPTPNMHPLCPATNSKQVTVLVGGTGNVNQDFADTLESRLDLSVVMTCDNRQPGTNTTITGGAYHASGDSVVATITLDYDPLVTLVSAGGVPAYLPYVVNIDTTNHEVTWTIPMIAGDRFYPSVEIAIPSAPTVNINDVLNFQFSITSPGLDFIPANNTSSCGILMAPVNPTFKSVTPGDSTIGLIQEDEITLTYTIGFQNTRPDTVYSVVIRDTFSDRLIPTTFQLLLSTHPVTATYVANNVLNLFMLDIDLPPASINPVASQGYISFSIDRQADLNDGAKIFNDAGIFLNFNNPIATNRTETTIDIEIGIDEILLSDPFKLYPNPADQFIRIESKTELREVAIMDMSGKTIARHLYSGMDNAKVDVSELPAGMYIITIADNKQALQKKVTITR